MNDWIAQLRKLIDERTARERWLLVAAAAIVVFLVTQLAVVSPLLTSYLKMLSVP